MNSPAPTLSVLSDRLRPFLLLALGLIVYRGFRHYYFDDPFITYRVAENLAQGKGWVYNFGEHINVTTSPLWTMLLAGLHFLAGVDLPSLGLALSILFLTLAAELLARALKPHLPAPAATLASIFVIINPHFAQTVGMETMLLFVLALAAILNYQQERWKAAGFFLSLAILARMDVAVLALILALHFLFTRKRIFPLEAILAFLIPLLLWFGFSFWYFGEFQPATLAVKIAQRQSGGHWGAGYILLNHLGLILARNFLTWDPLNLLLLALLGLGLAALARQRSFAGLCLLAWAAGHVLAYGIILNVPGYAWYFAPVFLALQVVLAVGVVRLVQGRAWVLRVGFFLTVAILAFWAVAWFGFDSKLIDQVLTPVHLSHIFFYLALFPLTLLGFKPFAGRKPWQALALILVAAAAVVPRNWNGWLQAQTFPPTQYRNYPLAAKWITQNLPKAKSLGANEIGILGWCLKDHLIVDQCGIPTPGAAEHLARRDYTWWILRYRPDALVLHPARDWWWQLEEPIKRAEWFKQAYRLRVTLEADREGPPWGKHAVEIWELVDDREIPSVANSNRQR